MILTTLIKSFRKVTVCSSDFLLAKFAYPWQRVETSHKQNAQCPGNIKKYLKQTGTECLLLLFLPFWKTLHSNFGTSH